MKLLKFFPVFSIFLIFLFSVSFASVSYASIECGQNDINCVLTSIDKSDYVKFTKSETEYGLNIEESKFTIEANNSGDNITPWFLGHQIPEEAKYYVKGTLTLFRGFKETPENSIFKTLVEQYPDLRNKDLSSLVGESFECIFKTKDELKDFLTNGLNEKYVSDGKLISDLEKIENIKSENWRPIEHTVVKKPAIYLYPTADSTITVSIDPNGTITKTIPDYKGKWTVNVTKNGKIDKKYDYLFYEATLNDSFTPSEGWIVSYNDLSLFFDKFLPILGLNKKEAAQFKEYWLKNLKRANYYLISPVSKEFIENNLKLEVTPNPDTVIRVILYFSPLDNPINIQTPVLEKPTRNGFTVVEWGGILGDKVK
ncbi:hypothetical protein Thena_1161 [Thermodesulfobium narugense DSM 14796]|uniref:Uncharacterized protein n=1 Tax=Thermodesulfobium narugense DSM 14796 TaxID=747365 RepID=M1E537_9BACT|nr:hypothetical protein [Thermodesulfobium narugense]AEE14782.1 hypothetical protein Thena_1161 [Thermodesulfobium narugense DSM 14796]